jgi:hypothetical protein
VGKEENLKIDYVYNLVLESGHIAMVNGISCCCLGHGISENDVIRHAYFGT